MEALRIKRSPAVNPKTKEKGFTVRVITNGRISYEKIAETMCKNTTLNPNEAKLAAGLLIDQVAEYLRNGYIVELGEVGTLQPSCSSGWRATEDELTKDMVKPSLFYRPADEIASAIRGVKLAWAETETPDQGDDDNTEL